MLLGLLCVLVPTWGAKNPTPPPAVFHRATVSLNENWQCALDPNGAAPREQWANALPENGHAVLLPLNWEHHPLHRTPDAVEWYSRLFTFPAELGDAGALLVIDNPVGVLEVYQDGAAVATCYGNGLTRRVVLHGAPGTEHRLTLRLDRQALPAAIRAQAICGLGPISLEVLPPVRVEACTPVVQVGDNNLTVRYRLFTETPCSATLYLELFVLGSDRATVRLTTPVELPKGTFDGEQKLPVKSWKHWSPGAPQLYRLRVTLLGPDKIGDTREVTCGICTAVIDHATLRIDGQPILLKGMRLPGGVPLLSQPTLSQTLDTEISYLRQAGFNAIMADGAALSEELLTLADRLGLIVIGEIPPGPPADGAAQPSRPDIRTAVEELGHHPCIVAWSWANDGMPEGDLAILRALDPARPVLLRDSAHSQIVTSLTQPARPFEDVDATLTPPMPAEWQTALRTRETANTPVLLSGIGVAMAPPQPPVVDTKTLLKDTEEELARNGALIMPGERTAEDGALAEIRSVVESMRRTTSALGYFVRPLRGGTLTGLNTLNGIPTGAFTNAVGYNQPCLITLRTASGVSATAFPQLEATVVNDAQRAGDFLLYQVLTLPDGRTSITQKELKLSGKRLQDISMLATPSARQPGEYRLQLLLANTIGVIASTQVMVLRIAD